LFVGKQANVKRLSNLHVLAGGEHPVESTVGYCIPRCPLLIGSPVPKSKSGLPRWFQSASRICHRAEQNQPEVSDSKPATLKCGIHIISGFSIKGFLLRVKTSRTGQRAF
jgi:hypothetical protein